MKTSESIVKITTALLKSQKVMGAAKKEATNPYFHSTYADLGSVMSVCKELLNENGILILQPVVGLTVETILVHESGEWMSSETPIVCKEQNNPQALGSAITYARRYGLQSMLFIPAEDDDANSAIAQNTPKPSFPDDKSVEQIVAETNLGTCPKCGAANKWSTTKNKSYCGALCWKN